MGKNLKKELDAYGVDTKGFFDKEECVKAVAQLRVDGAKKTYKKKDSKPNHRSSGFGGFGANTKPQDEPYDPSYRDVVMEKLNEDAVVEMLLEGGVIDTIARSD